MLLSMNRQSHAAGAPIRDILNKNPEDIAED